MLFCISAQAQVLFNKRIKTYRGSGTAYSLKVQGNDFLLFGGLYYNYGPQYNIRYLVIKTDSVGDTLFTKSYGKIKNDFYPSYAGGVFKMKNDNYYYDIATKADSTGHNKYFFYKLISNGDTIQTKGFGDTSFHAGTQTKITRKYNLVASGQDGNLDPKGDFSLIKTDTLGNTFFIKYYGSTFYAEYSSSIDTCKDGGYILGGYRQLGGPDNFVIYVVKTDSLGNSQWENTYGNYDATGILTFKNQGYLITGDYRDSVYNGFSFTRTNLIKIDNSGAVLWDKKYGTSCYGGEAIISYELSNGDIISCGQVGHINNPPVNNVVYGIYGFIMKTDSSGNLKFYQTYEATTDQGAENYLRDIKQLPDGGFVAVGFVQPSDGTSQDVWILRVDSNGCEIPGCALNTGIEKLATVNATLSVYPNPTNGLLTVNYSIINPTCKDATLRLIEMGTGRVLISKTVPCNTTQTQIDLNEFANGVYSLSIQSNANAPQTIRVVKVQ